MILKGLYGGYRVRWREHGVLRQRTFRTWNEARIFDGEQKAAKRQAQPPVDEPNM